MHEHYENLKETTKVTETKIRNAIKNKNEDIQLNTNQQYCSF